MVHPFHSFSHHLFHVIVFQILHYSIIGDLLLPDDAVKLKASRRTTDMHSVCDSHHFGLRLFGLVVTAVVSEVIQVLSRFSVATLRSYKFRRAETAHVASLELACAQHSSRSPDSFV
jgi:hypothetical protein